MQVVIKFSGLFLLVLVLLHLLAVLSIVILPWSLWVKLMLILAVILQFYVTTSKFVFLQRSSSVKKAFYQNGCWFLQNRVGDKYQVDLQNGYVSSFLILLNFKVLSRHSGAGRNPAKPGISVIIFKDGVENKDMWRKLRVRLFLLSNS